jgi:hypothetical protein
MQGSFSLEAPLNLNAPAKDSARVNYSVFTVPPPTAPMGCCCFLALIDRQHDVFVRWLYLVRGRRHDYAV